MKLKKIASLALAGLMAVSMLAGCNNGTGSKDDGTVVVANGMTGKVIAALDKDTTDVVSFSYSSDLENTLTLAIKNAGTKVDDLANNIDINALKTVDNDLTNDGLTKVGDGADEASEKADKKEQSYTAVIVLDNDVIGSNADYAAKMLAAQVEAIKAIENNSPTVLAKLPKTTNNYTWDDDRDSDYWYALSYKGDIAVVEVTDAVTGQTSYAAAVTITRTATKVEK